MQLLFNTVFLSLTFALVALSFSLIYNPARFFHFAHAIVFTFAAYLAFLFSHLMGWSLFISIPIAVIFTALLGCLMELLIYKPLRKKNSSGLILLLASLGIYIVIQNVISLIFGDDAMSIRKWPVEEGINVFGAIITPVQIIIISSIILILLLTSIFLRFSNIGKAMRAVASDSELANISGINSDSVILTSFAVGSALIGIVGVLYALDIDITPTMGINILLMGIIAMIVGGVGSITGIVIGSFLLALVQNLSMWYISSQWQDAIAFAILLFFLLFKPEGFFGKRLKKTII